MAFAYLGKPFLPRRICNAWLALTLALQDETLVNSRILMRMTQIRIKLRIDNLRIKIRVS